MHLLRVARRSRIKRGVDAAPVVDPAPVVAPAPAAMTGPFYTPIPGNPVLDPNSATKVATLAAIPGRAGDHHFAGLGWASTFPTDSGDPAYTVAYPPDPDYTWPGTAHQVDELNPVRLPEPDFYPQPGGMVDGAGWDGWAVVEDRARGIGVGFWRMRKESGVWKATSSHSYAVPGDHTVLAGVGRGDGLPVNAGSVTVAEAAAAVADTTGAYVFPHALAMAVPLNHVDRLVRFPAVKTDGAVKPTAATISEGSRYQMNPNAPAPATTNKITLAVWRTLKVYGAYIVDRTGVDGPVMTNFERMDPGNVSDMIDPGTGSAAAPSNPSAIAGVYYRGGWQWDFYPLDGTDGFDWTRLRLLARWDGT